MTRTRLTILLLAASTILLLVACLFVGSVSIPPADVVDILLGRSGDASPWRVIVLYSRVPAALAAVLCGASLAVAGLQLQTTFNNPLAGPSILGVSTGASLGVAVVMLWLGGWAGAVGIAWASVVGAMLGAMAILGVLLLFSRVVRSTAMLLIVGIIVSYLSSSLISLLNFFSTQQGVHSYVIWGLGSFSGVSIERLWVFGVVCLLALCASALLVKPLDALLLGEANARVLGVNVRSTRNMLILLSGILTASATAFCGPIAFLGLIVPHIARLMLGTARHAALLPATSLAGASLALLCQLISVLPSTGVLPINAITPVIGAPIILYVIVNRSKIFYLR